MLKLYRVIILWLFIWWMYPLIMMIMVMVEVEVEVMNMEVVVARRVEAAGTVGQPRKRRRMAAVAARPAEVVALGLRHALH